MFPRPFRFSRNFLKFFKFSLKGIKCTAILFSKGKARRKDEDMKKDNRFAKIQRDIDNYGEVAQILFHESSTHYCLFYAGVKDDRELKIDTTARTSYENGKWVGFFDSLSYILGYQDLDGWDFDNHDALRDYITEEGMNIYYRNCKK